MQFVSFGNRDRRPQHFPYGSCKWLQDPALWYLNRRSVAGAFAIGMFVMYLPPLGQLLIAVAGAIAFRVNFPISVALV